MKILILVAALCYAVLAKDIRQAPQVDLDQWLKDRHTLDNIYEDLHHDDQKKFLELMYAVEHDQLTQYIADKGRVSVLLLLARVDKHDTIDLNEILEKHLEKEAAVKASATTVKPSTILSTITQSTFLPTFVFTTVKPSTVKVSTVSMTSPSKRSILKRQATPDLHVWLKERHDLDAIYNRLRHEDRDKFTELMYAIEHNQLSKYIADHGLYTVLTLLSHVDKHQVNTLNHMIEKHLEKEAAMQLGNSTTMKASTVMASTKPTGTHMASTTTATVMASTKPTAKSTVQSVVI